MPLPSVDRLREIRFEVQPVMIQSFLTGPVSGEISWHR